jgi:uncharacterized protein (DUF302 family)
MNVRQINIERIELESSRSFEQVLAGIEKGIGRPNMATLTREMADATNLADFEQIIKGVIGRAGLMEFLRLDLGSALRKDPTIAAYRIIRIIAGNPLIMKQMTRHIPDAGSYAPITILIFEHNGRVHLRYDKMASLLAEYGSQEAIDVARDLDTKVIHLLTEAAGSE